jgi:hypothetical protein
VIPPDHPAVRERLLRPAAIVGLLGVALIHFLDVFDKFKETPYLGVAYVLLIAGCVAASWLLLKHDARPGWTLALVASAGTLAGFILSRTTGLPGARGDIGNWTEPLGLASLFVEGLVVLMSIYTLTFLHPPKRR